WRRRGDHDGGRTGSAVVAVDQALGQLLTGLFLELTLEVRDVYRIAFRSERGEVDILRHIEHVKVGAKTTGERSPVGECYVGRFTKICGDQDVLERDHVRLLTMELVASCPCNWQRSCRLRCPPGPLHLHRESGRIDSRHPALLAAAGLSPRRVGNNSRFDSPEPPST